MQIAELEDKVKKEGPKSLVPEQQQKIAAKAELLAELQSLGGTM